MNIRKLLLSAAMILAVSPAFADVPCGPEGNEHLCFYAKVGDAVGRHQPPRSAINAVDGGRVFEKNQAMVVRSVSQPGIQTTKRRCGFTCAAMSDDQSAGSTDATASIARSYPDVRYVYQAHKGLPVARNTGLANCTGELICFLDADDYWPPNKLQIQSAYLSAHPELGCVIGKLLNFLEDGMTRPHWISEPLMTEEGGGWSLGASLMQRWVFDRIGRFDGSYPYCDDLDWLIRLAEAKIPWDVLPGVFLHRRIHASNMSKDRDAVTRAEFRIMKAHMDRKRGKFPKPLPGDRQ